MHKLTYQDVPGWFDFEDIYSEAVRWAKNGEHFVEVGCLFGKSTIFLANEIKNSHKNIRLDAIDLHKLNPPEFPKRPLLAVETAKEFGGIRQAFNYYIKATDTADYINAIPYRYEDVVDNYQDKSLDLFFLDADHLYESTKHALLSWLPKMKRGSIFSGHDYILADWPGVVKAVDEVLSKDKGYNVIIRGNSFWTRIP
jgi:predicted O-methyltransferase YrrM